MNRGLSRDKNPMPAFVKDALVTRCLMDDFKQRPAYQQNDYLGWIARAKKTESQQKRLAQMLDELEIGGIYMKMFHPASKKSDRSYPRFGYLCPASVKLDRCLN